MMKMKMLFSIIVLLLHFASFGAYPDELDKRNMKFDQLFGQFEGAEAMKNKHLSGNPAEGLRAVLFPVRGWSIGKQKGMLLAVAKDALEFGKALSHHIEGYYVHKKLDKLRKDLAGEDIYPFVLDERRAKSDNCRPIPNKAPFPPPPHSDKGKLATAKLPPLPPKTTVEEKMKKMMPPPLVEEKPILSEEERMRVLAKDAEEFGQMLGHHIQGHFVYRKVDKLAETLAAQFNVKIVDDQIHLVVDGTNKNEAMFAHELEQYINFLLKTKLNISINASYFFDEKLAEFMKKAKEWAPPSSSNPMPNPCTIM